MVTEVIPLSPLLLEYTPAVILSISQHSLGMGLYIIFLNGCYINSVISIIEPINFFDRIQKGEKATSGRKQSCNPLIISSKILATLLVIKCFYQISIKR